MGITLEAGAGRPSLKLLNMGFFKVRGLLSLGGQATTEHDCDHVHVIKEGKEFQFLGQVISPSGDGEILSAFFERETCVFFLYM